MTKSPTAIKAVFNSYQKPVRARLLELRRIILDVAASTHGVGNIEETLKWGEPSFLTSTTKSGSTIRIAPFKKTNDRFALYFNCKTDPSDSK